MNKESLRALYQQIRADLKHDQLEDLSLAIANNCLNLPIWQFDNYHLFLSITKQKEVNTEYLLHILQGKDKNVIISKSNFEDLTMSSFLLTENTKIVINNYGIPEPEKGIHIDANTIEVVFVPLLAFDKEGNRVGYGKGFYDRFLSECNKKTIKIGLSFFEPLNNLITNSINDVPLDYCVTPKAYYRF